MREWTAGLGRAISRDMASVLQDRVEVVGTPGILGGMACVAGTRVPAETIRQYLIGGYDEVYIREDYPTLPVDGIDAVIRWANARGLPVCAS